MATKYRLYNSWIRKSHAESAQQSWIFAVAREAVIISLYFAGLAVYECDLAQQEPLRNASVS